MASGGEHARSAGDGWCEGFGVGIEQASLPHTQTGVQTALRAALLRFRGVEVLDNQGLQWGRNQ